MKWKRFLSALLTLSLVLSLCVTTAFAADGPKILRARLINDRDIEVYWDQEVTGGSATSNFQVMVDGQKAALSTIGTVYFDQMTTLRLANPVNETTPPSITVTANGGVTNEAGVPCAQAEPVNAPYEAYYTQFLTTETGILIKASPKALPQALPQAKAILDIMLSKDSAMAKRMANAGCCLGIYGKGEHAFYIPEHRDSYNPDSLYVEGFGGTVIATIKDANVLRLLDGDYTTSYWDECILVHEFAHTVKNYGLTEQQQNQFEQIYNQSIQSGKWPNSYAGSNSHEFFATLSAIWFNVMNDTYDGQWDGVRGPINTRDELCSYDRAAYDFMASIYPAAALPAPWDSVPNNKDVAGEGSSSADFSHKYKIITRAGTAGIESNGGSAEAGATIDLWWDFSTDYPETAYFLSWTVVPQGNGLYQLLFNDTNMALTPQGGSTEAGALLTLAASSEDSAQLWRFVSTDGSYFNIVNEKSGCAIALQTEDTTDGTAVIQASITDQGTSYQQWKLVDMTTGENLNLSANVNTAKLEKALAQCRQVDRARFTKTSLEAMDAAVASAQALLDAGVSLQSKVDTAAYQVQSAYQGLVPLGDSAALEAMIGDAALVKEKLDQYEDAGKEAFLSALESAKALLATGNQTDAQIDAALALLQTSMDALQPIELPALADTSRLEYAIDKASNYHLENYIPANQELFTAALNKAEAVLVDKTATQAQVDEAKNALFAAMTKLRLAANKANLNAVIDQASAIDLSGYTEESAQAVRTALAAAQAVSADLNVATGDQSRVDDAQLALEVAIAALTIPTVEEPIPSQPEETAPPAPENPEPEDTDYPAPDASETVQPDASADQTIVNDSQPEEEANATPAASNPQRLSASSQEEASKPIAKTGDSFGYGVVLMASLSAFACLVLFLKKKTI